MEIRVETAQPHIVLVTIANEPRRNAMSRVMLADLAALWDRLDQDADCRCVVLTGAGEKAFCAGRRYRRRSQRQRRDGPNHEPRAVEGQRRLRSRSSPQSTAIGAGGGLELLLSTDIRAAAPEARFGLPEVRWSIIPVRRRATVKLAQQIGHVHAMDLLLTGRLVDARLRRTDRPRQRGRRPRPADGMALETRCDDRRQQPERSAGVRTQNQRSIADYAKSREALNRNSATGCAPARISPKASPPSAKNASRSTVDFPLPFQAFAIWTASAKRKVRSRRKPGPIDRRSRCCRDGSRPSPVPCFLYPFRPSNTRRRTGKRSIYSGVPANAGTPLICF